MKIKELFKGNKNIHKVDDDLSDRYLVMDLKRNSIIGSVHLSEKDYSTLRRCFEELNIGDKIRLVRE